MNEPTHIQRFLACFGDNQTEAAAAIQVSQPTVSDWSTGKTKPGAKNCLAIERATHGVVTRYELRPDIFGALAEQGEAVAHAQKPAAA